MDRHFDGPPRISGLWTDLATGLNGTYSWKQVKITNNHTVHPVHMPHPVSHHVPFTQSSPFVSHHSCL